MSKRLVGVGLLVAALMLVPSTRGVTALGLTFAPGDLFVSLERGPVQWRLPDGTLYRILVGTIPGTAEGMGFDLAGNLYVTRWCTDPFCGFGIGNTVERFDPFGRPLGAAGNGYNCSPHAILFDVIGNAYVGQAGCSGDILMFAPGMTNPVSFAVAPDNQGSFWIDMAPDRCHVFYTSYGPNVKRFDLCARRQLADFNAAPVPGGVAHDLRILPDGGVVVATGSVISRLNDAGVLVQTYAIPGEPSYWAGLDLAGDGTFWAANYESSNVYRFDLATGAVISGFNTAAPSHSVVAVRVKR